MDNFGLEIRVELLRLGFSNFNDILNRYTPVDDRPDANFARYMIEDVKKAPNQPRFSMLVNDKKSAGKFEIEAIHVSKRMETLRNKQGYKTIEAVYFAEDGPLPKKKQMLREFSERIRIEEIRERFFLKQNPDLLKQNRPRLR